MLATVVARALGNKHAKVRHFLPDYLIDQPTPEQSTESFRRFVESVKAGAIRADD
jgi:hypothetical protein